MKLYQYRNRLFACKCRDDSQGILDVFLDNVSLGVQRQDLEGSTKGVEQDGKEEGSTTRSETVGGSSCTGD